jgi:hypothetical protein
MIIRQPEIRLFIVSIRKYGHDRHDLFEFFFHKLSIGIPMISRFPCTVHRYALHDLSVYRRHFTTPPSLRASLRRGKKERGKEVYELGASDKEGGIFDQG